MLMISTLCSLFHNGQNENIIVQIKIKPKVVGSSTLSFTNTTSATALDAAGNYLPGNQLKTATDATVNTKEPSDIVDDPYFDKPGDLVNAADLNKLFSDWKKTGTAAASSNIVDDPDDKGVKIINAHDLNFMFSISQWPK